MTAQKFIAAAKSGRGDRLMGFGHRVYKNYDPRAKIIKASFYKALASLGIKDDPSLNIAMKLEEVALNDEYFVSRKLYPERGFLFRPDRARCAFRKICSP